MHHDIFLRSSHQEVVGDPTIEIQARDFDVSELSRQINQCILHPILLISLILTTQPFRPFCAQVSIQRHSRQLRWRRPTFTYHMCPLRVSNRQRSDVPESECSSHNLASSSLSAQFTQRRKRGSCSSLVQGPCHLKPNRGEMERLSISTVLLAVGAMPIPIYVEYSPSRRLLLPSTTYC